MLYHSTRGGAPDVPFTEAMLAGLAPDGGLYVPRAWPHLALDEIGALAGRPFHEVAARVVGAFAPDVPADALARMAREAFATFGHPATVPLVQLEPGLFVLELFHGPTLAFKDVAMQLLARLMDRALEARGRRATLVCATSGDTGGAAAEAFRLSSRCDLAVLFPAGRVSEVQRRMMTTTGAPNIAAIEVPGTFDDAQALVKAMFNHAAFRERTNLAGLNSINWARVAAQAAYFVAAAAALGSPHRPVSFAVPTGNFGDALAGHAARRMGVPIPRITIATNGNDIIARALATGDYATREVAATSSPSMDIQVSSNFERLLHEASGGDAVAVRAAMGALGQGGRFAVPPGALTAIRAEFDAAAASEDDVAVTMRRTLDECGYLLDPHTACAVHAARALPRNPAVPLVVLATAHPAKFPDAVEAMTGVRPALPARLEGLMRAREVIARAPNDLAAVERAVEAHAGRAREAA